MAQRGGPKASKKPEKKRSAAKRRAKTGAAAGKTGDKKTGLKDKLALSESKRDELEHKCAELADELENARKEIKRLKDRQNYVLDRIDWAIDSLHNILEEDD